MWEVICPACGALMEADDMDGLFVDALLHTRDAHGYEIPREHVDSSAQLVPSATNPGRNNS